MITYADGVEANMLDYRSYTAPGVDWYYTGRQIFDRLVSLGLRPGHTVLDVGCGALRVGGYLIEYLGITAYFGIEPYRPLVEMGSRDLRPGLITEKGPQFYDTDSFEFAGIFPASFDFILMSSIWTHASHEQIRTMLRSAARAGTRGVTVLADYRDTTEDYLGDTWSPSSVCHSRGCIEIACEGRWVYRDLDRDTNQWCVLNRK